ncbi:polysaccharide deacetylase [Paenibacillus massiliensis]|uniref:polysaccharide deacetylase n=1 Tax=Paenibacillus massiliensis TaxID=225917 RepID=UPI000403EC04|nr:polysaccharide deacetylase [Paenibacillus massiliensis]
MRYRFVVCVTILWMLMSILSYEQALARFQADSSLLQSGSSTGSGSSTIVASARTTDIGTVYLTFDDGPGKYTGQVLDILQQYDVQATFFVLGEHAVRSPELIRRMAEEGHVVGNHTYNHSYEELYRNFQEFWSQIKRTESIIHSVTGERPALVRAPGGTYGHFDDVYYSLLDQAGYTVVDWNVDSGDSRRSGVPAQEIVQQSIQGITERGDKVVLLHDGGARGETVKALPRIIEKYQAAGYSFAVLTPEMRQWQFPVSQKAKALTRSQPGKSWIAEHILTNRALLESGPALHVAIGAQELSLSASEYEWKQGHVLAPLRSVVEKLGGTVVWQPKTGIASVRIGERYIEIHARQGGIYQMNNSSKVSYVPKRDVPLLMVGAHSRNASVSALSSVTDGVKYFTGYLMKNKLLQNAYKSKRFAQSKANMNYVHGVQGTQGVNMMNSNIEMRADSLYLPLRDLLEGLGYVVTYEGDQSAEYRIKAI